jgi:hypothetical protein
VTNSSGLTKILTLMAVLVRQLTELIADVTYVAAATNIFG